LIKKKRETIVLKVAHTRRVMLQNEQHNWNSILQVCVFTVLAKNFSQAMIFV